MKFKVGEKIVVSGCECKIDVIDNKHHRIYVYCDEHPSISKWIDLDDTDIIER